MSLFRFLIRSVFIFSIGLGAFHHASAQISVDLKPERLTYVAHEAVNLVVTITNRTGRDITLRGPTPGVGWLNFSVQDSKGDAITPRRGAPIAGPETLAADQPLRFSVNINEVFPVNRFGSYRVVANVYNPDSTHSDPSRRYSSSQSALVKVDEAAAFWQDLSSKSGRMLRYSLLKYRDVNETLLYFRLIDEETGAIRRTYKLGSMLQFQQPQAALDNNGNLHVLYQASPRQFLHVSIGSDGEFIKQQVYDEEQGDRPKLMQSTSGGITVTGGVDPDLRKRQNREKMSEMTRIRKMSERPPGY